MAGVCDEAVLVFDVLGKRPYGGAGDKRDSQKNQKEGDERNDGGGVPERADGGKFALAPEKDDPVRGRGARDEIAICPRVAPGFCPRQEAVKERPELSKLSEKEQAAVKEFAKQIDVTNSAQVLERISSSCSRMGPSTYSSKMR